MGKSILENSDLSRKQKRILEYFEENIAKQEYIKSKHIAKDIELSAKEIGSNMNKIINANTQFEITPWGRSRGTTWFVQRKEKE